jgi:ABC-type amino acid transport substrate-binding protein
MSKVKLLIISIIFLSLPVTVSAESILQQVQASGEIKVCIWPDYFTISYRNPRNNKLEGIDIDMAYEFAKSLAVKVKFIDSSFAKLAENMTNDRCDISMHAVGVRDNRKPYMDFSEPHLISGIYAVSMKSDTSIKKWDDLDQPGKVIVVQKGTYMEPVMKDYLKHAELSVVDSFKAREQEVQSGRADAFMTDFPYGQRMASLTKWANLLIPDKPLAPTPYAYAVPKNDPEWLNTVNNFVRQIKADGRLYQSAKIHGLTPIVAK